MASFAARTTGQPRAYKEANTCRSRSTSAGSSTQESSSSDQQSPGVIRGPPGLTLSNDLPTPLSLDFLIQSPTRTPIAAPPGLEDATPAGKAASVLGLDIPSLPKEIAKSPSHRLPPPPAAQPPVLDAELPPPPPVQPPALDAALLKTAALPPPVQAPPWHSPPLFPPHMAPFGFYPQVQAPRMPFLPPPPLQPPVLDAEAAAARILPPPPTMSAPPPLSTNFSGHLLPPPTEAPILAEELEAPLIPPPPEQLPVLNIEPEVSALASVGSAQHATGDCKPCAFIYAKGCSNGKKCAYCHLCEPGEKKRRVKEKREQLRAANQLLRASAAAAGC